MTESTSNKQVSYILMILVFGIILLLFDALGYLNVPKSRLNKATVPLELAFSNVGKSLVRSWDSFTSISRLRVDNDELRKEIAKLQSEVVIIDDLQKENEILRSHLSSRTEYSVEYIAARVVTLSDTIDRGIIKIDKGSEDGIEKEDVVVYQDNLVGVVDEVLIYTSSVRLIDSTKSSLLCKTFKTDAEGILAGTKDGLMFSEVSVSDSLVAKDKVIFYSERVPFPLTVGYIDEIYDTPASPKQQARVETYLPLASLSYVFIIK